MRIPKFTKVSVVILKFKLQVIVESIHFIKRLIYTVKEKKVCFDCY